MARRLKLNLNDILLVEDNPGDIRLMREVLKVADLRTNLIVCRDGEDAMNFLHRRGNYPDAVRPDLILLDLNLPRKSGSEVLAEIKANHELKAIPVIILTTSSAERDILQSYELYANCYITKPVDLNQFTKIVQRIRDFWFGDVKLPPQVQA